MNRRSTLKFIGAASLGLSIPALAFHSADKEPKLGAGSADAGETFSAIPKITCRIIGVGDIGIQVVARAFSSGLIHAPDCQPGFAAVSMGRKGISVAITANRLHPELAPIRPVQLGRYGAGGDVNVARAAARKYDRTLRSLVDGAEIVVLAMCISGGTGSSVGPILAKMAQEIGALTLAVVIIPFPWEVFQFPSALQASKDLERECTYLVTLRNGEIGTLLGRDATLNDLATQQELIGTACIHRLMLDGSRFCIERLRPAKSQLSTCQPRKA